MQRLIVVLTVLLLAGPFVSLLFRDSGTPAEDVVRPPAELVDPTTAPTARVGEPETRTFVAEGEDSIFSLAAEIAWEYVETQYQPATGLVNSVAGYQYATIWDIASTLAAYYSAHQLGLMADSTFNERTSRALATLNELPLFADGAFNKNYDIRRAVPTGQSERETGFGYGWSTTDLGRLLIWLRIIASEHPAHAAATRAIVDRLDFDRLVRDGYLWGANLDPAGRPREFPEGRIGYEQYAAAGFALWDRYADLALSVRENGQEIEVLGVPVLTDVRENPHLTSEPFILMGLEVGWWSPHWEELARGVLAAQQARFEQTGQLTIVSEDAVPVAPYYFYYYTLNAFDEDFAVVTLNAPGALSGPRWISAKASFGWYALEPSNYTWQAVETVMPAGDADAGWEAGIYEQSGRPTGGENINSAAIILEAALYRATRSPILAGAGREGG